MFKLVVLLFCLFTLSSAGFLDFVTTLLGSGDKIPVKVKTLEDYNKIKNESVVLDFVGLVQQYEFYKADGYEVITEDNYVLKIHRIYATPASPEAQGKPVVYIQHGLLGSSDLFVLLGPNQSLAFQLADAGYDVWLGNVRGNTYSRSHLELDPEDSKFWDFSMDEMGLLDLSKSIDTVLNVTKQEKLTYIGYSMGTTLSYILLSSKLEYNSKINLVISIAPVAYFLPPGRGTIDTLAKAVIFHATYIKRTSEILPQSVATAKFANKSCNGSAVNACQVFFSSFLNVSDVDKNAYPKILPHIPAGTSFKALQHYQQINTQGKFQKYDFPCGFFHLSCLNFKKYKSRLPPIYDTTLITAPVAILYSAHDIFATVNDTLFLKNKLKNVVAFEKVTEQRYNHLDYVFSKSSRTLVNEKLLKIMSDNL